MSQFICSSARGRFLRAALRCSILASVTPLAGGITVYPAKLSIVTVVDGKAQLTLIRVVNVSSAAAIPSMLLDADDLVSKDAGVTIDQSNIHLSTATNLLAGADIPVSITIAGLQKPGHYSGAFALRAPAQKRGEGAKVTLDVNLVGKPVLAVGTPALSAVSCGIPYSCSLSETLLGASRTITVDSQGVGDATDLSATFLLRANRSNTVLSTNTKAATLKVPKTVAKGTGAVITLETDGSLPADRYQGFVRVNAAYADDAVSSNVTFDVRHAPWIAMFVLTMGILSGRFVQAMSTPRAVAQQRLFGTLSSLQNAASGITDPALSAYFARKIEDARQAIAAMIQADTDLNNQMVTISASIAIAKSLQWIENAAAAVADDARAQIMAHVRNAKTAMLGDDMTTAENERRGAQQALLGELNQMGGAAQTVAAAAQGFQVNLPRALRPRPRHLQMLQALSGTEPIPPELKYAYAKPILFLILLIGLILVGIYTLYVKNTTFGADIVYDYFGLLVWGLSADVAQRTLQTLQLNR